MSEQEIALKQKTARLSIISNTTLVIAKLVIGFMTGTVSLISEGIHSGVDLVAAGIAFMAVKKWQSLLIKSTTTVMERWKMSPLL